MEFQTRREQLAWAASLFNGEGSTGSYRRHRAIVTLSQGDRWVLDQFRSAVMDLAEVRGPYKVNGPTPGRAYKPRYTFAVQTFEKCQAIIAMLWPWLSPEKRAQAAVAFGRVRQDHRRRALRFEAVQLCTRPVESCG